MRPQMNPAVEYAKLSWRCKRGMRELDVLLERYLKEWFPLATVSKKQAFARLLELQDPVILGYLLKQEIPADPVIADVINEISAKPDN